MALILKDYYIGTNPAGITLLSAAVYFSREQLREQLQAAKAAAYCPIGFEVTSDGVHYYLTKLLLNPHETRAIDIRTLRDTRKADFRKTKIPAAAIDGTIDWIRLDKQPIEGRLMVIQRRNGLAASYDCYSCCCPPDINTLTITPDAFGVLIASTFQLEGIGGYLDCDENELYYELLGTAADWVSSNPGVVKMTSTPGQAQGISGGTGTITFTYYAPFWACRDATCVEEGTVQKVGYASAKTQIPTRLKLLNTTSQGKESICSISSSLNGAGYYRQITWQVLDQFGQPILVAGLNPSDSLNAGGTNTCGLPKRGRRTGTGTTNSSGQFPDTYSLCSTACLNGGNCQSTVEQTWTISGHVLSGDVKTIVYKCTGITINGQ